MIKNFPMGYFVAGFMVGVVSIGIWFINTDTTFKPLLPTASVTTQAKVLPESGAISVANQPAGSEVIVESVTVSPPGVWVAVREVQGNELGNVLGASRVIGPRTSVVIPLLRATLPGLPYAVELYRDDSNGEFNLITDSVYVDFETGTPVISRFMTTN